MTRFFLPSHHVSEVSAESASEVVAEILLELRLKLAHALLADSV
jgi:hypothetical protein